MKYVIHKLLIIKVLSVFCLNIVQAQGWFQTYEITGQGNTVVPGEDNSSSGIKGPLLGNIQATQDGGYVGLAVKSASSFGEEIDTFKYDLILTKTDQFGNIQWMTDIEGSYFEIDPVLDDGDYMEFAVGLPHDLIVTPEGEYLVVIAINTLHVSTGKAQIYLQKYDAFGNLVSENLAFDSPDYLTSVQIMVQPNGKYVISAIFDYGVFYISDVEENGNTTSSLWLPDLTTEAWLAATDVIVLEDGTSFTTGVGNNDQAQICAVDEDFSEKWSETYEAPASIENSVTLEGDNGNLLLFLFTGDEAGGGFRMIDIEPSDGSIIQQIDATDDANFWSDIEGENVRFIDACIKSNGNILLAGIKEDQVAKDNGEEWLGIHTTELSSTGTFIENHNYFVFNSADLIEVTSLYSYSKLNILCNDDDSFVISGRGVVYDPSLPFITPDVRISYLLKIDSNNEIYTTEICGTIYDDFSENCLFESSENGIDGIVVELNPLGLYTITDSLGNYCFNVNAGDYTITTNLANHNYWGTNCPVTAVSVADNEIVQDVNIGYYIIRECPLMGVSIGTAILRPCLESVYSVEYCNDGTIGIGDIVVEVDFDTYLQIDSASVPYTEVAPNLYAFELTNLPARDCETFQVFTTVDCDAPIEATACVSAHVYPDTYCDDVNPLWDGSIIDVTATCEGDSVAFEISNTGGAMILARGYGIYEDDLLEIIGSFQLGINESVIVKHPTTTSATYRLEADAADYYPGNSDPQATIEMCGVPLHSLGFLTTNSPDDYKRFVDIDCRQIMASFDPNDKLVVPSGIQDEHYVKSTDELEYTIRFQNTGNDTAFNVYLLDTLSEFLDISTFISGVSSHHYEVEILGNNVIRWNFDDIYLVDSITNEPLSHGFVKFFIQPIATVAEGTVIENDAAIYFDFNAPIMTPENFVTICDPCVKQRYTRYWNGQVYLEGAYENDGTMHTSLNAHIPTEQPYDKPPYNYFGTETLTSIPPNMVDWVLVEVRIGDPNLSGERGTQTIETRAGLLMNDGSIRDLDGTTALGFERLIAGHDYHFCLRHRNHLDVMTAYPTMAMDELYYDFTTSGDQSLGYLQTKEMEDGKFTLFAGDYNADGVIQVSDFDVWNYLPAALNVYRNADGTLDGIIQLTDSDIWQKNKAKIGSVEINFEE